MTGSPNQFKKQAKAALDDEVLQTALQRAKSGFINKRAKAIKLVEDFDHLKQRAQHAKQTALNNLPHYLNQFEKNVTANGGVVHWAETPHQLNEIVFSICEKHHAKLITKGKSMISEETELNQFLEKRGIQIAETDLGEYIIQLAHEKPSHIIAPAVHKTRQEVAKLFKANHPLGNRDLEEIRALVDEARSMLREQFINAEIGITGANLLVADSGSVGLVTNEGNGDLTATLPKVHIVTSSIEKVVADMNAAADILNVLGRSATGQPISTYTSFFTGPKRTADLDGPEEFHVVLLDNHRSDILNSEYKDMLRCIKCGACLNHCPVYGSVGGHAYGWVYPGPMGSVLTPLMQGTVAALPLPNASTFCGRCEEVCPMGIPLPELLRKLRNEQHQQKLSGPLSRYLLAIYGRLMVHPRLFNHFNAILRRLLILLDRTSMMRKILARFGRQLPQPQSTKSFLQQWQEGEHDKR
ncbi:MAG: lactate utilization protein [Pseudomonadales bacterium]|nr:lactate utilization protein [Pseudomonadales bacterium]